MGRRGRHQSRLEKGSDYASPDNAERLIKVGDVDSQLSENQTSYAPKYKVERESEARERAEDQMMSSRHKFSASNPYAKRVIFADRPAYEKRSNNIVRESWSYHSLFPSLRTFIPLLVFPLAAIAILFFGYRLERGVSSVVWSFWGVAVALAVIFFFLESTKARVSHGLKDALVHGTVLMLLLVMHGLKEQVASAFLLYLGGHFLMHMIDFHLERSPSRAGTLILFGSAAIVIELLLAVAVFAGYLGVV
ncbi:MAG: hypothetical protein QW568_03985 [Candidatus Anstonellaceae archaeon]